MECCTSLWIPRRLSLLFLTHFTSTDTLCLCLESSLNQSTCIICVNLPPFFLAENCLLWATRAWHSTNGGWLSIDGV